MHRVDDIFTAIRIAKEFDLNMTLDHCSEGHLILFHGLMGLSGIAAAHTAADILSVAVSMLLLFRQYRMLVKKVEEQSGD